MEKKPTLMEEICTKNNQDIALKMAYYCVRDTIIEDYHTQGKISDSEMKALNIEVVNNIFTILEVFFNPKFQKEHEFVFGKFPRLYFNRPTGWNTPELDERKINGIHNGMERQKEIELLNKPKSISILG